MHFIYYFYYNRRKYNEAAVILPNTTNYNNNNLFRTLKRTKEVSAKYGQKNQVISPMATKVITTKNAGTCSAYELR
jgi:hypothetical protein